MADFFTVFNLHTHSAYDISVVNAPVAQWIGHPPPKREIPGSSPGGSGFENIYSYAVHFTLCVQQRELL